ncbi:MAG: hypothetical protein CL847_05625 [Crocinitomicaceae bacterium]|nr:hypothetical protein [Crocinitomicaceae bacterium]|tara:strand:+ start:10106 stop:10921 length:816 start_codon:yes stop_codon:yes gene_type:complete
MTFERLKPFLVLILLGILLIGGKLYFDYTQKIADIKDDNNKAILDCEKYRDHFNAFINETTDFNSLNISETIDSINASKIELKCKKDIDALVQKCKKKQLDFLSGQCHNPNIQVLIDEFMNCTLGSSFQGDAQEILDCIEYLNNSYQADLNDFVYNCKKTAENTPWTSSIWNSKAENSKITKNLNAVSSCHCCRTLKNEVNIELNKWKSKHKYYANQYKLLQESYEMKDSDGPRDRTIIDGSSFQKALNNLPKGSYYYNLHTNSGLSFHNP